MVSVVLVVIKLLPYLLINITEEIRKTLVIDSASESVGTVLKRWMGEVRLGSCSCGDRFG